MAKESDVCDPELMESEDLLFMLYTSGSTGKPKGIAHSTAGYLLYAMMTQKVSQIPGIWSLFACPLSMRCDQGYVAYFQIQLRN